MYLYFWGRSVLFGGQIRLQSQRTIQISACYAEYIERAVVNIVEALQDILGKRFELEGEAFTVVDTRNINGEVMVYAAREDRAAGPQRAAFRLSDVQIRLQTA